MESLELFEASLFFKKVFSNLSFIADSNVFKEISLRYRDQNLNPSSLSFGKEEVSAYIGARMPATMAAIGAVLERLCEERPLFSAKSFLDLGSGPGSFLWAFLEKFQTFERGVLWERNPFFLEILDLFLKTGESAVESLKNVEIVPKNILESHWNEDQELFDLVSLCYVLSEILPKAHHSLLEKAWMKTRDVLILIEPGTPDGFLNIRRARHFLKQQGGFFCAPCSHQNLCPLENTKDWCHFKIRLKRSVDHKRLKSASLPYEDEKYAYLIVQKTPLHRNSSDGRILKSPLKRRGHVIFDVCTQKGEERFTVSQKTSDLYKEAQKKEWGDLWKDEKKGEKYENV